MTSTAPDATSKNWLAIVAIVGAFVLPPAGIVFGHLGLSAAKRGEADNRGLALAATIIGYVVTVAAFAVTAASVALIAYSAS